MKQSHLISLYSFEKRFTFNLILQLALQSKRNKQGPQTGAVYVEAALRKCHLLWIKEAEANREELCVQPEKGGKRKQAKKPFWKRKERLDRKLSVLCWLMGRKACGWDVCLNMHSPYVLLPPRRPLDEDGSARRGSVLTGSSHLLVQKLFSPLTQTAV